MNREAGSREGAAGGDCERGVTTAPHSRGEPSAPLWITVITLTPERREGMKAESEEPVLLTRDELVAELRKRFGLTEEQTANNPTLRDDRYYFWPSIGAWTSAQSD